MRMLFQQNNSAHRWGSPSLALFTEPAASTYSFLKIAQASRTDKRIFANRPNFPCIRRTSSTEDPGALDGPEDALVRHGKAPYTKSTRFVRGEPVTSSPTMVHYGDWPDDYTRMGLTRTLEPWTEIELFAIEDKSRQWSVPYTSTTQRLHRLPTHSQGCPSRQCHS